MTGAAISFNAQNVEPMQAFDAIPSGWQNAAMTDSELKPTKDGLGKYLLAEYTIIDGPYKGRKIFDQLNIVNSNPVTVEMAYKTLSAICHAIGTINIQQTSAELHNKPLKIKLKKREARRDDTTGKEYDANNEVKGYDSINSDHPVEHTPIAGGVAGSPIGQPVWAANGNVPASTQSAAAAPSPSAASPLALGAQPWAQPAGNAGGPPPILGVPGIPAVTTIDPMQTAVNDGWIQHPQSASHFYKGQEVVTVDDLRARYAVAGGPPAIPGLGAGAPPIATGAVGNGTAPWLQK